MCLSWHVRRCLWLQEMSDLWLGHIRMNSDRHGPGGLRKGTQIYAPSFLLFSFLHDYTLGLWGLVLDLQDGRLLPGAWWTTCALLKLSSHWWPTSNKCIATSNKCLTSSNKKLLGTPGPTTRNKKLLVTSASLLVTSALLVVTRSY